METPSGKEPVAIAHSRVAQAILDVIGNIPETDQRKSQNPRDQARHLASIAAGKAGLAAGGMASIPGPAGMLTVIPELLAVWRLQSQMVSDIAAVYGQKSKLTQEQMLYCLFKATAAKAVGELVVIIGQRVLIRRPALSVLQRVAQRVGIKVTQKLLGKGIARWLPIVGALGVGAFTYYETGQVAQTAIELFEKTIEVETTTVTATPSPRPKRRPKSASVKKRGKPAASPERKKKRPPGSGRKA